MATDYDQIAEDLENGTIEICHYELMPQRKPPSDSHPWTSRGHVMKLRRLLAGTALASSLLALPALAQTQTVAPLTYVQPLSPNAVRAVQEKLRASGTYHGAADGVWGPDSATALQRFQATHQLQVTGQLNQVTVTALGLDPATLLSPPSGPGPSRR